MNKISLIYNSLYSHFGHQLWWPVTLDGEIEPKYHKNVALNEKQKLEICFGAILAQNTSWKNVEKAIVELNKNNLIDTDKILKISNKKLAETIKSSGYHNQKAKKLKNFCKFLMKKYDGNLNNLFQNNIDEWGLKINARVGFGADFGSRIWGQIWQIWGQVFNLAIIE